MDTPANEPSRVNAGDTATWRISLDAYPANEGWELSYVFINAAGRFVVNAQPDGRAHLVHELPDSTAAWPPGDYDFRARVTNGTDAYTVGQGRMTVAASFEAPTLDQRSTMRRALEAVEAYLADADNLAAAEYQIAGRQLRRHTLPELWKHRDRLRAEVAREDAADRAAKGLPHPGRIYVRFGA